MSVFRFNISHLFHCCSPRISTRLLISNQLSTSQFLLKKNVKELLPSISRIIDAVPCVPFKMDKTNILESSKHRLDKDEIGKILKRFYSNKFIHLSAHFDGLDTILMRKTYFSFLRFCKESDILPADLHSVFSRLISGKGHVKDLLPHFFNHAHTIFPHLTCMEELNRITDMRNPANWYPEARSIKRRVIYHSGPTNSGKTYQALEAFFQAPSGVYCGPLKMLAGEVFHKASSVGTPCDLITGEERHMVDVDGQSATHLSCTIEMTHQMTRYQVAVIDEIQMIRDPQRGWAWTRALLGVCADEVHVCGESSAIELVRSLVVEIGDDFVVHQYDRLTPFHVSEDSLKGSFHQVKPGDCIVCFSKADIMRCVINLEKLGHQVAVIYGSLPPFTKLAQAAKFNDPDHPCKIMVATDAIGMGLNLSIGRVVFYSLRKPAMTEEGVQLYDVISTSQALQIAGRAGRYNTNFSVGEATTFSANDIDILHRLLGSPYPIVHKAGIQPTTEIMELLSFHIPSASLTQLLNIFSILCQLDDQRFFICPMDNFKFFADSIEHLTMSVTARYIFCCAPINLKSSFMCNMFVKLAGYFAQNVPVTRALIFADIQWPLPAAQNLVELSHLEDVVDVLDLYMWLGYRFPDIFPDIEDVRVLQNELDRMITDAMENITGLLHKVKSVPKAEMS